jgi:hypothetical protein
VEGNPDGTSNAGMNSCSQALMTATTVGMIILLFVL